MTDLMTASELLAYFRESGPYPCAVFGLCPNEATLLTLRPGLGVIAGCASCMERQGYRALTEESYVCPGCGEVEILDDAAYCTPCGDRINSRLTEWRATT